MTSPHQQHSPTNPDEILNQISQLQVAPADEQHYPNIPGQYRFTSPNHPNPYITNPHEAQHNAQNTPHPANSMLPYPSDPTSPYTPNFSIPQPSAYGYGQIPSDILSPMTTGGGIYEYPGMEEVNIQQQQAAQQHHQQQQQLQHQSMGNERLGGQGLGPHGQGHHHGGQQGHLSPRQMGQNYGSNIPYYHFDNRNHYYPGQQHQERKHNNNPNRTRSFTSPQTLNYPLPPTPATTYAEASQYGLHPSPHPRLATQIHQLSGGYYNPPHSGVGYQSFRRGMTTGVGLGISGLEDRVKVDRSEKLEMYRSSRQQQRWEIKDVQGYIVEFSGDQHGSRFIQSQLESASLETRSIIFEEIMPNAFQLMVDVFGNYVIQKMFEHGNQIQKAELADKMVGNVLELSLQMYGCRVVQKALEYVLVEQRARLVSEIEPKVIDCVKSANANHVIQRLIALGPPPAILKAFENHIHELSSHAYGCRVLQKAFECLSTEEKAPLVEELHGVLDSLIEDQFGNYVVQSVITTCDPEERDKVIAKIKGKMHRLCRHKFASNVCEKALLHAKPEDKDELILELIDRKSDGSNQCGSLLRDAFGNFPLQTCLTVADEPLRSQLLAMIQECLPSIRHTPVGKRLEGRITQMEAEEYAKSSSPAPVVPTQIASPSSRSTYGGSVDNSMTVVGSPVGGGPRSTPSGVSEDGAEGKGKGKAVVGGLEHETPTKVGPNGQIILGAGDSTQKD